MALSAFASFSNEDRFVKDTARQRGNQTKNSAVFISGSGKHRRQKNLAIGVTLPLKTTDIDLRIALKLRSLSLHKEVCLLLFDRKFLVRKVGVVLSSGT